MDAVPYTQGYIFFITFLGGILIGLIWDFYRIFRYYITLGKKGTIAGDVIFWAICLFVGLKIIIYSTWGNLRGFIFAGFLLGGIFYFYAFSKYTLRVLKYIVKIIVLLIMFIWFLITYPLMLLKYKIEIILSPYKRKLYKNIDQSKRRYKFFKYKVKKVLNDKKIEYNRTNRKQHFKSHNSKVKSTNKKTKRKKASKKITKNN